MNEKKSIGIGLAIRREGKLFNAYLAQESTMKNALLLGSLLVSLAARSKFWDAWKELMTEAVSDALQNIFKERPDMIQRAAPEHERSGDA